jgi:hypothetical protein
MLFPPWQAQFLPVSAYPFGRVKNKTVFGTGLVFLYRRERSKINEIERSILFISQLDDDRKDGDQQEPDRSE